MVLLESGVPRGELPISKQESKPLWQPPSAVGGSSPPGIHPVCYSQQPYSGHAQSCLTSTAQHLTQVRIQKLGAGLLKCLKLHKLVSKLSTGLSLPDKVRSSRMKSWMLSFKVAQASESSQHSLRTSASADCQFTFLQVTGYSWRDFWSFW